MIRAALRCPCPWCRVRRIRWGMAARTLGPPLAWVGLMLMAATLKLVGGPGWGTPTMLIGGAVGFASASWGTRYTRRELERMRRELGGTMMLWG